MSTYTVVRGDTLDAIARRFSVPGGYQALARENNIPDPNLIKVGQVIKLPPYDDFTVKPRVTMQFSTGAKVGLAAGALGLAWWIFG